ncbi:MAG: GEVED domain-containing protein, partial [Acidimicrobiia bacterium]|nr:GEVED domain-containing protein [Acidimicrobiia bacterium]
NVTDTAGILTGYWHSLGDQSQGTDDTSKSDTYGVTLSVGTPNVLTVDFGYYVDPGALGNRVWIDEDFDGIQDPTELTGIPNVEVTLVITYPSGPPVVVVTTTDANGFYEFPNLLIDEDYNGDGLAPEPTFVISIDLADPDNIAALAGVGPPTMIDVNNPADDFRDSDDPAGVSAFATQGITDVSVDAPTPANEADPEGSYDFGFRALEFDWGDLPDGPYATQAASNGPNHETSGVGNVFLGIAPDNEINGQQSIDGLGDDNDLNGDDEDGVLFLTPLVPGFSADIDVTTSGAGFLSAFIDFNSDGDFLDLGEVVASDLAVPAGTTTLNIASVPAGATGTMGARFRITNLAGQGGASPVGPATTGEVEDYVLGCIGDMVWNDLNGDGAQDGGAEVGVDGVTVRLVHYVDPDGIPNNGDEGAAFILDGNGVPITTTTAGGGFYEFCGLPTVENSGIIAPPSSPAILPGQYWILFDLPGGFTDFSPPNTTGDANDSDADQDTLGTGIEGLAPLPGLGPITINSGVTDDTVDAGLRAVTAALITSAAAYNDGGSVVFEFSTGYEALSASFEVHRFDEAMRDYVSVTERPISALLGSPQGGVYRVVDEHAPFSRRLSYVVVEHQADGRTRAYGPFSVSLEARGDRATLDESSSARQHVSKRLESRMAKARAETALSAGSLNARRSREGGRGSGGSLSSFAAPGGTVSTAQVNAREAGLYYVASLDLAAALGLPESNVRSAVQKGNIVVENQG